MSPAEPGGAPVNGNTPEEDGEAIEELGPGEFWTLKLYVAGQSPRSLAAFANLKKICSEYLPGKYSIEVIDLLEHPQLAAGDQIIAIPTLIRQIPTPMRKIIGDLSNTDRVLVGLDLRKEKS